MDNPQNQQNEPTEQELRDLGSAEANAWTITPPGGEAMSLDEHAKQQVAQQAAREAKRQEGLEAMREEMASEAATLEVRQKGKL